MSDESFIVRNQLGQFWTRAGEWVDGREPQRLMKFKHRDEAVNQLVELSAKDIDLRGEVASCELGERGEPQIEVSASLTPTLAERAAAEKATKAEATQKAANDSDQETAHAPPAPSDETQVGVADADASEPPTNAVVG